jgi:hypothetical protein
LLRGDDLLEFKKSQKISHLLDEVKFLYGEGIHSVLKRVFRYERRLLLFSAIFFELTMAAFFLPERSVLRDNMVAFAVGVTASLAAMAITYLATNLRGK